MKRNWQIITFRVFSLLAFGAFFTLTFMSFKHGQLTANTDAKIDINYHHGHVFINKEIVREKIKEFVSDSETVHASSLSQLENYLQTHPHIEKAYVFIDSKAKLHVNIEQINPIARVLSNNGNSYYIDENRIKVPTSEIYTAKVPVLTGYLSEPVNKNETVQSMELESLIKIIELSNKDEYWSAQIAQLYINSSGEIYLIPRLGHHEVTLGDSSSISDKLKRLEVFYESVSQKAGWDAFRSIDVQYKNQIVCK